MRQQIEKQTNSEIIGSALAGKRESNSIGTPLGKIGSVVQQISGHATPAHAAHIKHCLTGSLPPSISSKAERDDLEKARQALSQPTASSWCQARVMTLLSHYYVSQADEKHAAAIALDWYEELKDFPAWAISNACRWWLSADNENRRKKPLPGDIAERAFHEMGFVRIAGHMVNRFDLKGPAIKAEHKPEPELSDEQKAELEAKFAALKAKMSEAALAEN